MYVYTIYVYIVPVTRDMWFSRHTTDVAKVLSKINFTLNGIRFSTFRPQLWEHEKSTLTQEAKTTLNM